MGRLLVSICFAIFDRMQPDVSIDDLSAKSSEPLPSRIIEPVENSNVKIIPSSWIHEHGQDVLKLVVCPPSEFPRIEAK